MAAAGATRGRLHEVMPDPASPLPLWRTALLSLAGWYGFGVLLHWHEHLYWGAGQPLWPAIAVEPLFEYGPCALLWPLLLRAVAPAPALAPRPRAVLLALLPFGLASAVLLLRGAARWWFGDGAAMGARQGLAPGLLAWLGDHLGRGIVFQALLAAGMVGVAYALAQRRFTVAASARAAALREELLRAQLGLLRARLQPHFLFNALHAVGVVARRDVDEAERMLALLGDLLRDSLRERPRELVSLRRELELLQPYLELQRIRFRDRLRIAIDAPPDALAGAVPDLLLQPLVENALQHGIEQRAGPGTVAVRARRDGGVLRLEVCDDGRGPAPGAAEGIGLGTTRERLRALFGSAFELRLAPRPGGGSVVHIALPWSEGHDG